MDSPRVRIYLNGMWELREDGEPNRVELEG